jgi:hypothetical protein
MIFLWFSNLRMRYQMRLQTVCLIVVCLCLPVAGIAQAQAERTLKESLLGQKGNDGRTRQTPPVAKFITDKGDVFILDQSQRNPLIQFDGKGEVWSLTPTPGTMGDVIFKNDLGEPVVKSTRWGGLILFSPDRPNGDPVAVLGTAEAFEPGRISPQQLFHHLVKTSRRASSSVSRLVRFEADVQTAGSDYLFADAATVAADAIMQVASTPKGREALGLVQEVRLIEGRPPGVRMDGNILELKLDLSRGWAGRPSSKRVARTLSTSIRF